MTHRAALGLVVLLIALSTGAQRAQASLRFCNNGTLSIDVAIGYVDRERGWVSEGWWVIDGGQCKVAISSDLNNRYYYYYATGRDGTKYTGETAFCIDMKKFTLYQSQYGKNTEAECTQAGLRFAKFRTLDVEGSKNHTLNLGSPAPSGAAPVAPGASAAPAPQVVQPPAIAGGNVQPRPYQPPAGAAPQLPAPPPAAAGGGAGGTACQRYPNLC